ncbi:MULTISPECIES: DNA oxidative demethylase AlkB [unclassified Pseudomonas]|uniref:DNA oxidative demethylase AlkB n=2 Tax=Pseudomonas TaxID=286 RepID=UPI000C88C59C|nr:MULTISPECIES: DNA oxidative demethylase AlkB [unclassified Pseudomonas]PMZ89875.1 DNA oxidative demethylase AlkB [Pseudomonas sp. FW305-42]PNA19877.1 DNA oxidative demethylase AlkB [Pseudomonas sp. MPR-R1B]PNB22702.1 DNA oxidative demethylase AlkB [Pseudomonas sp. DP16D-E2]PNB40634.1 DNA oxidative demethylase AlkB [Pseudomonas sp. FW305-17]PNB56014.1 DNA oxidative demethylase AlkB [Pseudomonas sp. GW531-E2]
MIQSDLDLFDAHPQQLAAHTTLLPGFALAELEPLLDALRPVLRAAPFRHMQTPGGLRMAVALSNCGALGWVSDASGYRYSATDPVSGKPWPALPRVLVELASRAAAQAGFEGFVADACLINHYLPGTRLSLHQDRDEQDYAHPIVSISLGLPAVFLFGGLQRSDRTRRIPLNHGDVLVWGGEDRLRFHGVLPIKPGVHPRMGERRINLTLRKAGCP